MRIRGLRKDTILLKRKNGISFSDILPSKLSQTEKRVVQLYKTQLTNAEIAKELGIGLTSLKSTIKTLKLTRTPRLKKKSINIKLFKTLVQQGVSNVNIAQRFHICTDTVLKRKKQLGLFVKEDQKISRSKKAVTCRTYYKKTGTKPECPYGKNILEKYGDTVISLLENGVSKTKIAHQYGVSLSTVYNFIYLYGLNVPQQKIWQKQEQEIKESFKAGKSLEDISKQMNSHVSTTYRAIKNLKLRRNPEIVQRKTILNCQTEKIKSLYRQGVPCTQIANKLGVSSTSMYACVRRHHIDKEQRQFVRRCTSFSQHDKELIQMHQDGMSLRKIAAYFGVHVNTVLYRLKKCGGTNA